MGVLQLGVPGGPELFIRTHRRRSARLEELERRLGRHDRRPEELEEGN